MCLSAVEGWHSCDTEKGHLRQLSPSYSYMWPTIVLASQLVIGIIVNLISPGRLNMLSFASITSGIIASRSFVYAPPEDQWLLQLCCSWTMYSSIDDMLMTQETYLILSFGDHQLLQNSCKVPSCLLFFVLVCAVSCLCHVLYIAECCFVLKLRSCCRSKVVFPLSIWMFDGAHRSSKHSFCCIWPIHEALTVHMHLFHAPGCLWDMFYYMPDVYKLCERISLNSGCAQEMSCSNHECHPCHRGLASGAYFRGSLVWMPFPR